MWHCSDLTGWPGDVRSRGDIVAKVFLWWRTKILRAADAFYARRCEGPYRFIQNRSRTSVVALKSNAAAEKSKDQLSRDFLGCSIFDFCNNIGGKADFVRKTADFRVGPLTDLGFSPSNTVVDLAVKRNKFDEH
jgi:hypothetical protein